VTKKVLTNDMVAHVWAQLSQPCGYNSSRSMSFDGARAYSYREHEATLVRIGGPGTGEGKTIALFNSNARRSVTTKRHVSRYYIAARHYPRFTVPSIGGHSSGNDIDHARNIAHLVGQYEKVRARLMKCPADSWRLADQDVGDAQGRGPDPDYPTKAHETLCDAARVVRDYCKLFGVDHDGLPWQEDADEAIARRDRLLSDPKRAAKRAAAAVAREAREARQAELDRADLETRIAAWRAGENVGYLSTPTDGALLRIKGGTVQTSRGAECPLEDARKAYRKWQYCVEHKAYWAANGEQFTLGQFRLDAINGYTGEVRAGCHTIMRAELEHFGKLLEVCK
jgi:hypothetical protein